MHCDEVEDLIYEFIYHELDNEKNKEVEEHINNCSNCKKEYEGLKLLLIDDMKDFIDLAEEIQIPQELSQKVVDSIKSRKIRKFSRYATAICMIFVLICGIPVAAQYIVGNSFLDKYKQLDPDIASKYSNYKGEMIEKSSTMKDIIFTVDAIIDKRDSTTILFTVKADKSKGTNYAMPVLDINTITFQDQLGIKYRHIGSGITLRSVNEDGEIKGIMDVEPLKFYVTGLTVRITAMEVGNMTATTKDGELQYDVKKKRNIYGNWQVKFRVHK
ncbi:anti-sigma factor family protein [Clostridium estertheticum]|uniref:anti-sigma factor family protein n=1 Tax=Clostridium estertheticum TaxID=238834 RepID=UPI001CF29FCE|nr:zf-HC2 domain-containing protein [Clostridium estertheticum]MCB2358607.1 zf-HC2 domain-containing protein [Clostridium estertheticum]